MKIKRNNNILNIDKDLQGFLQRHIDDKINIPISWAARFYSKIYFEKIHNYDGIIFMRNKCKIIQLSNDKIFI